GGDSVIPGAGDWRAGAQLGQHAGLCPAVSHSCLVLVDADSGACSGSGISCLSWIGGLSSCAFTISVLKSRHPKKADEALLWKKFSGFHSAGRGRCCFVETTC